MQIGENVNLAILGLVDHKFRSFLTILGIIFGVASVIAMVSIGEGAKKQAIAKYQDLGVSNIIVRDKDLTDKDKNRDYLEYKDYNKIKWFFLNSSENIISEWADKVRKLQK